MIKLRDFLSLYIYEPILFIGFFLSIYLIINRKIAFEFFLFLLMGVMYEIIAKLSIYVGVFLMDFILMFHLYQIGFLVFWAVFFYPFIENSLIRRYYFFLAIALCLISLSILLFHDYEIKKYNQLFSVSNSMVVILLSIVFILDVCIRDRIMSLKKYYPIWLTFGIVLWSSFNLFRIAGLYYFYTNDPKFSAMISLGFTLINILTYSIFIYGMYQIILEDKHQKVSNDK